MTEFYVNSVRDFSKDWFQESYNRLPGFRQEKADRFRMKEDRLVSILAGTLLREALLSRAISDRDVLIEEHGKPFLTEEPPWFSISHTGPVAVLAISDEGPVGADVEEIRRTRAGDKLRAGNWEAIARRFYTDSEKKYLDKLEEGEREKTFFGLWTCKEAYGKLMGGGLEDGLPFSAEKVLEKAVILDAKDSLRDLDSQLRFCSLSEYRGRKNSGEKGYPDSIGTARVKTAVGDLRFFISEKEISHRNFLFTICIKG
ncbi:MAG: 4'-phosphopantetheinyl transferase superfamily protein [Lachnospiraceae bacterium]|nr:4'-phosphopantetheinyl transferase superfamily protein [Lachnospiraceae bacterium]